MSDEKNNRKVILRDVMLSYPHLVEPQPPSQPGGKPKYTAALVLPPGHPDLPKLKAAAIAAAEKKWPGRGPAMLANGDIRSPFRTDGEKKNHPAGSVYINTNSDQRPGCVYRHAGKDGKPEVIPTDRIRDELYAGAFVNASVEAYAYDRNGNRGVSFSLNNIQKWRDGQRIDGRKAAEDEFDADLSAVPADLDSVL